MLYNIQNENEFRIAFNYAKRILSEKGKVIINVSSKKQQRSTYQNSYYWGVIVDLSCEVSGYSPAEQHEVFKQEILGSKEVEYNGKIHYITNSTAKLNTSQFEDFAEHCRAIAAEWYEIMIPLPNEVIDDD